MRLQKRGPRGDEPETVAAEPPQDEAMGLCLHAWRDLSTERAIGMGAGPIPESKCREWCGYHGLTRESTAVMWAVICRLERDRFERENSKRRLEQGA
jgi:hypothetical protein